MKQSGFYKFIKSVGGALVRLLFPITVVGKENIPNKDGFILCCNHTHILDVAFLVTHFKNSIFFMAKQEAFKHKIGAYFLNKMGAFPVARGSGAAISAIKTAKDVVKSGNVLGIFPEGTRSKDGTPQKAKSGTAFIALSTGAQVLPVSIFYKGKLSVFKKITMRIGKPIITENNGGEKDRKMLRQLTSCIMDTIKSQWEEGHC